MNEVPTALSRGNHGLLALTMDPEKYFTLTGSLWITPMHPGLPPVMAVETKQVQATNLRINYKNDLQN